MATTAPLPQSRSRRLRGQDPCHRSPTLWEWLGALPHPPFRGSALTPSGGKTACFIASTKGFVCITNDNLGIASISPNTSWHIGCGRYIPRAGCITGLTDLSNVFLRSLACHEPLTGKKNVCMHVHTIYFWGHFRLNTFLVQLQTRVSISCTASPPIR